MKKPANSFLILSLLLVTFLSFGSDASAQVRAETGVRAKVNVSTGTSSTSTKERMLEKRDALRENAEQRISKHADEMVKRFNAMIERLEKLSVRIESRITKIKAEGASTTEAETHVANAKVEIKSAKDGVAKIPQAITIALEKEKLAGSFEEVRTLTKSIREDLKTAHQELVKAITNIKGLRVGTDTNATTNTRVESVQ